MAEIFGHHAGNGSQLRSEVVFNRLTDFPVPVLDERDEESHLHSESCLHELQGVGDKAGDDASCRSRDGRNGESRSGSVFGSERVLHGLEREKLKKDRGRGGGGG